MQQQKSNNMLFHLCGHAWPKLGPLPNQNYQGLLGECFLARSCKALTRLTAMAMQILATLQKCVSACYMHARLSQNINARVSPATEQHSWVMKPGWKEHAVFQVFPENFPICKPPFIEDVSWILACSSVSFGYLLLAGANRSE